MIVLASALFEGTFGDVMQVIWLVVLIGFFVWTMRKSRFTSDYEAERPALKRQERIRFLTEVVGSDAARILEQDHWSAARAELRALLAEEFGQPDDDDGMETERVWQP